MEYLSEQSEWKPEEMKGHQMVNDGIRFFVPGKPRGKGRPRFARMPRGKIRTYTPQETRAYEGKIREAYLEAGGKMFPEGIPLKVEITSYMPIPKSAGKAKAEAMERGVIPATSGADVDNQAKAVLDAGNSVIWRDDKQVTILSVQKKYAKRGSEGGLDIRISVVEIDDIS